VRNVGFCGSASHIFVDAPLGLPVVPNPMIARLPSELGPEQSKCVKYRKMLPLRATMSFRLQPVVSNFAPGSGHVTLG